MASGETLESLEIDIDKLRKATRKLTSKPQRELRGSSDIIEAIYHFTVKTTVRYSALGGRRLAPKLGAMLDTLSRLKMTAVRKQKQRFFGRRPAVMQTSDPIFNEALAIVNTNAKPSPEMTKYLREEALREERLRHERKVRRQGFRELQPMVTQDPLMRQFLKD